MSQQGIHINIHARLAVSIAPIGTYSYPYTGTVTIDVDYSPPSDFVGGPNDYRAASSVILTCQVKGTGAETYRWTSSLPAVSNQPNMRSRTNLRSSDSGSHTCTATRDGMTGSATIEMNVVGE